jgi:hypothetical protein
MLTPWQKQAIDKTIEKLIAFYHDSSKGYFSGSNKIEEYSKEERSYFDQNFSLTELVGANEDYLLNQTFEDSSKLNFALYLLRTSAFSVNVNNTYKEKSIFEQVISIAISSSDQYAIVDALLNLYRKGYVTKESDVEFTKQLYNKIDSQEKLIIWCLARFVVLLNDVVLIEKAFLERNSLLTIVSFKLKKPVGINYPNLLGVANNAFLHYRAHGDVLLQAMKHYGVYDEVLKRDQKKSFTYRLEDFQRYKPIQDPVFVEIAYKVFPELKTGS